VNPYLTDAYARLAYRVVEAQAKETVEKEAA
jgi:hypothetical protein